MFFIIIVIALISVCYLSEQFGSLKTIGGNYGSDLFSNLVEFASENKKSCYDNFIDERMDYPIDY